VIKTTNTLGGWPTHKKNNSKMATAAILKNRKIAISKQLSGRSPLNLARLRVSTLDPMHRKIFDFFKIEDGGQPPF